jgi:uncharacterized oxidoreductase
MKLSGNTVLITGGGAGIGRGLAEALHAEGNRIIIAGRRESALRETVSSNPGIESVVLDVNEAAGIESFAARIIEKYPALNVLINNAGIMRAENLAADSVDLVDAEAMITTNLLGPIRLTAALLPHLRRQPEATIINVTSGLAFVPLALTPTYSATKAAMHSHSQSLRYQLRKTSVRVVELAPPAVATDLMPTSRSNPNAMSLEAYIRESMALLKADPDREEICVERVRRLRDAEAKGTYAQVFAQLNPS